MAGRFPDPLPPGDISRDWLTRMQVAVNGTAGLTSKNTFTNAIIFSGTVTFNGAVIFASGLGVNDDVPLKLSNTTLASAIYRKVPNTVGFANGAFDLLAINITTHVATFGGAIVVLAGAPIVYDGSGANSLSFNPISSNTVFKSINTDTLYLNNGHVTIPNGNLDVSNGDINITNAHRINLGNNLSIRADGSGWGFENSGSEIFRIYNGGLLEISPAISSSAASGVASPLPPIPAGYISISIIGYGVFKIPAYN